MPHFPAAANCLPHAACCVFAPASCVYPHMHSQTHTSVHICTHEHDAYGDIDHVHWAMDLKPVVQRSDVCRSTYPSTSAAKVTSGSTSLVLGARQPVPGFLTRGRFDVLRTRTPHGLANQDMAPRVTGGQGIILYSALESSKQRCTQTQ